jgi:hypothetical protein
MVQGVGFRLMQVVLHLVETRITGPSHLSTLVKVFVQGTRQLKVAGFKSRH